MRATPCLHGGTRPLITRTRTHTHNGTAGAHGVVGWCSIIYYKTFTAVHTHCTSHSFNPNHPPTHPLTFSKTSPLTHLNELYRAYTRHETALHHTLHHTAPHPHPHHTPTIYCTNYNCHTTPHHTTPHRVVSKFQQLIELTVGLDDVHQPLPAPTKYARLLRKTGLELLYKWHEKHTA